MAGKRKSTAKNTQASKARAKETLEKKQQQKRQKTDKEPKKPAYRFENSDSDSEEETQDRRASPKKPSPTTLKLQKCELEIANLRKENAELKARQSDGSSKDSGDEDSDFSDKDRNQGHLDEEEQWSRQKQKKHVKKHAFVPVAKDMRGQIFKSAEKILFRYIKFIPDDTCIKPACEKLLEKDPQLQAYKKVKSLDPKAYKKLVKQFVADYGDVVCRAINKARTTAQSEMQKAFIRAAQDNYFAGGVDSVPTPKELQ